MDKKVKKKKFDGSEVEVIAETYEEGTPTSGGGIYGKDSWRAKVTGRKQMVDYIKTSQRYWYAESGFGSEKRKNPA